MDLSNFQFIKQKHGGKALNRDVVTISRTSVALNTKLAKSLNLPAKGRAKIGIDPLGKLLCICFVPMSEENWVKYSWTSNIKKSGIVCSPLTLIERIDRLTSLNLKNTTYRFDAYVREGMVFVELEHPFQYKGRGEYEWHEMK